MKRIAETKLGHPVRKAVITVPAYFNDAQRTATKAAGAIAGLEVLRIINEPTAAALAYGLDKKESGDAKAEEGINVLIFDLGGGTFDVSILRIEDGMFNVKATGGDTHLGGEDFDNTVVEDMCSMLKKKHSVDAKNDPKLMRRLRTACEKAKRTLSAGVSAVIEVEDNTMELSRARFENLNKASFERTLDTVKKVMKDAKMEPSEIDDVVLVGGSTRIPRIQEMLSEFFGGRQLCRSINPDEAVAYGAAVQGAILSGVRHQTTDSLVLVDVTPLSLGIELDDKSFSVIIPRNTNIPCKKSDTFTTTENYQESIEIPVYEGERPIATSNRKLGEFSVQNIERAKQGEPKVLVTFELDANGILNITAQDMKTKAKADLRIEGACKGMDPSEVERMVREAEQFAQEDEEYRKQAEMRSELENLIWDLEESDDSEAKKRAQACKDWLEGVHKLGSPATGKALRKWLTDLGSS
jgi:L1 cell adhesion molecule like protein